MSVNSSADALAALEARINALLPPRYVGCFEDVSPSSMGSAKLRYDKNGQVVWGEIWTTFCHLALAGGPPHRGRLLPPVTVAEVDAAPERYAAVIAELDRALRLCVTLPLAPHPPPGWIGLTCNSPATAAWLTRAIIAENVSARHDGAILRVPAGPEFRIEKEIKNVVVSVAKCCHYLFDHLEPEDQPTGDAPPLIGPPLPHELAAASADYEAAERSLRESIAAATGLPTSASAAPGWIGLDCGDEETAVWLLRAVAVENVLVRREEATLYLPVALHAIDAVKTSAIHAVELSRLRTN